MIRRKERKEGKKDEGEDREGDRIIGKCQNED